MERKKILIVEDNSDLRFIIAANLRRMGYQTLEAGDGYEAVVQSLVEQPDLVLMDLGLPGLDGIEAVKRIKQDPRTAAIPVVAHTARVKSECREEAFAAGCSAYLEKPVAPLTLKKVIEKLIGDLKVPSKTECGVMSFAWYI